MARPSFAALVSAVLFVSGCSISTGSSAGACDSTTDTGPCTGTFSCGNSGIQLTCSAATQVCVVQPGMVNCVDIASASGSTCPSPAAAVAAAGCSVATNETCSGSSSTGITVNCPE